jgi:hypothetical protein
MYSTAQAPAAAVAAAASDSSNNQKQYRTTCCQLGAQHHAEQVCCCTGHCCVRFWTWFVLVYMDCPHGCATANQCLKISEFDFLVMHCGPAGFAAHQVFMQF